MIQFFYYCLQNKQKIIAESMLAIKYMKSIEKYAQYNAEIAFN